MKYQLKQGMLQHPFSDQSGLVLFNPVSKDVTSVEVTADAFACMLSAPHEVSDEYRQVLDTLISMDFIEQYE